MPDILPVPIIQAKLYPPTLAPDTLTRERLMALAPDVAGTTATLISAPAGYGKSTLASHWLTTLDSQSAWITLDPSDNDPVEFLSYLVAAFRAVVPGCCSHTALGLTATSLAPAAELAGIFCNDFTAMNISMVLVLDDFQNIASAEVLDFVDALLRRPPHGLHIVIISRRDPSLSLHELRARGTLTEVRMRQLAFNSDESNQFIGAKLAPGLATDAIAKLHERTEGWPVGMRLAALAISQTDRSEAIVEDLPKNTYVLQDYLLREVLAACPAPMRELLLRSAFLQRFCAPLCDAVSAVGLVGSRPVRGAAFVKWINESGLFVIPLDGENVWFRFHQLFRAMLIEEATPYLGDEVIRTIQLQAAEWFERTGSLKEAIDQLIEAGDTTAAGQLITRHQKPILNNQQWHLLDTWLNLLPEQTIMDSPELLILRAISEDNRAVYEACWKTLDQLEAMLRQQPEERSNIAEIRGSIETLRSFQHFAASDGIRTLSSAELALRLLPEDASQQQGSAITNLCVGLQILGRGSEVLGRVLTTSEKASASQQVRAFAGLAYSQWMDGNLSGVASATDQLSRLAQDSQSPESRDATAYFAALFAYETNALSDVVNHLQATIDTSTVTNGELFVQSQCLAAIAFNDLGNTKRAAACVRAIEQYGTTLHSLQIRSIADALNAALAHRRGRHAEARHWALSASLGTFIPHYNFFQPTVVRARILADAKGAKFAQIVNELITYLEQTHNVRFLAETLAIRALMHEQNGQQEAAKQDLIRALSLTQTGRFTRLYIDLGPRLGRLLSGIDVDEDTLTYVAEILAAFRQPPGTPNLTADSATSTHSLIGVEPLSTRELQILTLLAERLSNKEIADKLHISTVTVKRHAANIYQKLGVHGRRQAVTKANGLGMFDQHRT